MSQGSRFNLSRYAIDNPSLTRYLLVVLLLGGIFSYFQLGQDEDPPFSFRVMVVRAFWPGATTVQMADQVSDKLEKALQEIPAADRIRSYSKPGETTILFQIKDSTRGKDIPQIWYTVRKKISDIRHTLPQGVQGPFFNDDFGDVYGVIYALEADGFSYAELKHYAEDVRQELLRVPDVAKVEPFGVQDEKVYIEISQKRLSQMRLNILDVVDEINRQNSVDFAGTVRTPSDDIQVRISGQFQSVDELRQMPLRIANRNFRLSDLATVNRGYVDPPAPKVHYNGKEVIALGISMTKGGDIIKLGEHLAATSARLKASLPVGIELHQIQDQPKAVATSVQEFLRVLAEALIIVLVVSFLALGLHSKPLRVDIRPGMVVALSIPSVLAVTFLIMDVANIDLHKISLGSLIIALGLLVDDAIIVVEMMVRKLEEGWDKVRASTYAYDVTAMPMLTGTLITAAGFLPIGLANSATGEYTFAIFAVTTAALLVSWLVSVYFVPFLGFRLLRVPRAQDGAAHELFDTPLYNRVRRAVTWCVEHRWLTIGVTAFALVLGIAGMGKVEKQFFPDSSRPEIVVDLWLAEGSSVAATEDVVKRVEQRLRREDGVVSVTSFIATGTPRFYLPLDQIFPQHNVAQLIVLPTGLEARNHLRKRIVQVLTAEFPEVRGRAKLLPNGPPVPYPVQFRVVGPDPQQVRLLADQVKDKMRANANMVGVNDNWNESIKVLKLDVDQARARALGVTAQSVSTAARALLSGVIIGQYREDNELIEMVIRQPVDERNTLTALQGAYLPTSSGQSVLISQVARVSFAWEPGVIWRENRDFAITVQGDLADGIQGATVTQQIDATLGEVRTRLPEGYHVVIAGTVEESKKGQGAIVANVPLMLFIMFTLLMLQLKSFSRSLLVFLTGPLGIVGAAATLLLLGRPFGFVAMLGVIALNGMIIRNSVILIDQIEQDIAHGVDPWHAVIEAAVRRCRPIVLTAAAAVLAMIPLSHSVFWGPMAVAIMGGLVVATALTLLSLPAMYAAWFRVQRPS